MPISNFKFRGPPIDDDDLRALENHLGVALPPPYRAFLLRVNGGRPSPEDVFESCLGPGKGSMLRLFFYVRHPDRQTRTIAHQRFAFEKRIPDDLLPIGVDAGGSIIGIGIGSENYGKVYFWKLYDEIDLEEGEKPGYYNVYLLAEDFDQFLDSFYDMEPMVD